MSEKIEPALTSQQWAEVESYDGPLFYDEAIQNCPPESLPYLIALANAALPDSDPRKITREKVDALRITLLNKGSAFGKGFGLVNQIADALSSYLPPEK